MLSALMVLLGYEILCIILANIIIADNAIVPAATLPSNLGSQGPAIYLSKLWV
jgi:hypothetical protein